MWTNAFRAYCLPKEHCKGGGTHELQKIIPYINGENELAANVVMQAEQYCFAGADALFLYNYSKIEAEREEFLATLKEVAEKIDIPFMAGMYMERFEDAKKCFIPERKKLL